MPSESATPVATESRIALLAKMLRAGRARKEMSQAAVCKQMGIGSPALSQFENGQRLPSVSQLLKLADILDIDSEQIILALTWENVNAEGALLGGNPESKQTLLDALAARVKECVRTGSSRECKESGILTLRDWPEGFDVRNVLVGDRREQPPHNFADVLALPASTGDLSYFGDLGLKRARIRSDKIVKIADPERLQDKLRGDLLVVGSPAANLAARIVNSSACHRFHIDRDTRNKQKAIEAELKKIAYDGDALEAYVTPSSANKQRIQNLKNMLYAFAKPGFICPTSYPNETRGNARNSRIDFGVVTLCDNPWSDSGVAILAAGIGGPGTAASLKALATRDIFDEHPLGGVFKVRIATEAKWENRYDMLKPAWDSNPYRIERFKEDIGKLGKDRCHDSLDEKEAQVLSKLLSKLESRA